MAFTLVSNIAVFSDQTGHGNQNPLVYVVGQNRWWFFYRDSKTANTIKTVVSSGGDLATATWSAGTTSPALGRSMSTNDQRNLAACYVPPELNDYDVVHLSVGIGTNASSQGYVEHGRARFTGSSSIVWDSWAESATSAGSPHIWHVIKGNALGVGTDGFVHESAITLDTNEDMAARRALSSDGGLTSQGGFAAAVAFDTSMTNNTNSVALIPSVGNSMLAIYDNGQDTEPNLNNLRYGQYLTGSGWTGVTGADVFTTTSVQDQNDWAACGVTTAKIFCVRRTGTNTFEMRMFNGSSWSSKTAPPTQRHKAGSGIFLATDGTDMWMFVLDSVGFNDLVYCKYSVNGDSWGSWTVLEAAGSAFRNYLSGCPYTTRGPLNQIGVVWTEVNGSNFDIKGAYLNTATLPASVQANYDLFRFPKYLLNTPGDVA